MNNKQKWILSIRDGTGSVAEHSLEPNSKIIIGRSRVCDVVVDDRAVSRKHCMLELSADGDLNLVDLGASMPSKLNGLSISAGRSYDLESDSTIGIGKLISMRVHRVDEGNEPVADDATAFFDRHEDRTKFCDSSALAQIVSNSEDASSEVCDTFGLPVKDEAADSGTKVLDVESLPSPATKAMDVPVEAVDASGDGLTKTRYFDASQLPPGEDSPSDGIDKTMYVSPEELKELVGKKETPKDSNKLRKILLGALGLAVLLLFLPKQKDSGAKVDSDGYRTFVGDHFSFISTDHWKMMADREIYLFKERGRIQVFLFAIQNEKVRQWTYQDCFREMLPRILDCKGTPQLSLNRIRLQQSGLMDMPSSTELVPSGTWNDGEIPFACFYSVDTREPVKGRLYLNGDTAICLLFLDKPSEGAIASFLEEFRMEGSNQYIDRRLFKTGFDRNELRDRLEAAVSLIDNYDNSDDNGWKAYGNLLEIRSWISLNSSKVDSSMDEESWRALVGLAQRLQDDFSSEFNDIARSRYGGSTDFRKRLERLEGNIPRYDWRYMVVKDALGYNLD